MKRKLVLAVTVVTLAAKSLYPSYGKVVKVDHKNDVIRIRDTYGNVWVWSGAEDWQKGDGVALLMYDNGTPSKVNDDKIIKLRYVG